MATSITHRVTGVALSIGTFVLAWWLIATATGPAAYHVFAVSAANPIGQIILFGFLWSLAFHFFNGIRHLAWDVGLGFDVPTANRSGISVVILSLVSAIVVFLLAHGVLR